MSHYPCKKDSQDSIPGGLEQVIFVVLVEDVALRLRLLAGRGHAVQGVGPAEDGALGAIAACRDLGSMLNFLTKK
jgi:hypothetical protein